MASVNVLQQVVTYNDSNLALLLNSFCFLSTANKKFAKFNETEPKNLGDTVSFDLPPRFTTVNGLVVSFQPAVQRVQNLVCDQSANVGVEFTAQQYIFNVKDYMAKFGKSAVSQLGTKIESNIATLAETNTYRFYGDGVTPISTSLQLGQALEFFRNYGAPDYDTKGYLSNLTYPQIINSNANQFTLDRNNREIMSWELGEFSGCQWYRSNLLKVHTAGSAGQAGQTLTVVSTTLDANGAVVAITFSGGSTSTDPNYIKAYDKFVFNDGVSGFQNLRFRTFIGQVVSEVPVQFAATADAASVGGTPAVVTVNLTPPLQANAGATQNLSIPIVAGMQVTVLPSHRCGLIMAGDPLFVAMPRLPDEDPYKTANQVDPDSGASMRMYVGSLFGQNQRGTVWDALWGKTLVPEYAMMVALPV